MSAPCISLLTDFGVQDTYVGVMHGVIAGIAPPRTRIVDLSHEVAPQDVAGAAFYWEQALPYFPVGSVHLAVVDPGVGTARRIVFARRATDLLVAPDNGLLTPFVGEAEVFELTAHVALAGCSTTFHGRDVFSPLAARLARGEAPEDLGRVVPASSLVPLERAQARQVSPGVWCGTVVHVDRFGNLITNLPSALGGVRSLSVGGHTVSGPVARSYAEREAGSAMVVAGSSGWLEVSISMGDAAGVLGVVRGAEVRLDVAPS
ncbi:MAG: SAM-dependent chlorinase/fluorinase [Planctomycetota bacterium]